ncbi:MAG TPA: 1-phosphofructokinase family hexose kinase [Hyphomicrobiales bacterium]|nr:1-phosphofructokinase family hexose kinase [Hyphomicrobiales bacterium]
MSILTLTLNPALDLSTNVDRIEPGHKLRCGPAQYDAGGGGINVSRAIMKLGGQSKALAAVGGTTGAMLQSLLQDEGIDAEWFELNGLTRQSFVANEHVSGKQFRFVLPGPAWTERDASAFLNFLEKMLTDAGSAIRFLVVSGSTPPGVPDNYHQQIAAVANRFGIRLALDTSGNALQRAALQNHYPPHIWVMDHDEATQLAEHPLPNLAALEAFAVELRSQNHANIIVLSLPEGGAVAVSDEKPISVMPPKVEVVSKVGAGDSFMAGLTMQYSSGKSLFEACAFAVAAAASAVTTPATELCSGEQTQSFFKMILDRQG